MDLCIAPSELFFEDEKYLVLKDKTQIIRASELAKDSQ
jgi:hypothetical protein